MARLERYSYTALCCDGCMKEGPRVTNPLREDEDNERSRQWDERDVQRAMKEGDWRQVGRVTLCPGCRKQAGGT